MDPTRATEENLAVIADTLRGMAADLHEPDRFMEHDLRFHFEIARATQNAIASSLVSTIRRYLQEWIKGSLESSGSLESYRRRTARSMSPS